MQRFLQFLVTVCTVSTARAVGTDHRDSTAACVAASALRHRNRHSKKPCVAVLAQRHRCCPLKEVPFQSPNNATANCCRKAASCQSQVCSWFQSVPSRGKRKYAPRTPYPMLEEGLEDETTKQHWTWGAGCVLPFSTGVTDAAPPFVPARTANGFVRSGYWIDFPVDSAQVLPEFFLGHHCRLDVLQLVRHDLDPVDVCATCTLVKNSTLVPPFLHRSR